MSFLAIAYPAQVAITYARPLLGLGALLSLFLIFKPMFLGLVRAALLAVKPRQSFEQRTVRNRLKGVLMLNILANEYDSSQPNLASELRVLAARG